MAPIPEELGQGGEKTKRAKDNLSTRLGRFIKEAELGTQGEMKLKPIGFIFEPSEGTVHPVVLDEKSEKQYALGGDKLISLFPITLNEQKDNEGVSVNWGGNTGTKSYREKYPSAGMLVTTNSDSVNTLGVDFAHSQPGKDATPDRDFVIKVENPTKSAHVEYVDNILNEMLMRSTGQRPELIANIGKGLEKAGMKTSPSQTTSIESTAVR